MLAVLEGKLKEKDDSLINRLMAAESIQKKQADSLSNLSTILDPLPKKLADLETMTKRLEDVKGEVRSALEIELKDPERPIRKLTDKVTGVELKQTEQTDSFSRLTNRFDNDVIKPLNGAARPFGQWQGFLDKMDPSLVIQDRMGRRRIIVEDSVEDRQLRVRFYTKGERIIPLVYR